MSALTPPNGKYRRSWKTWGKQVIPSKKYCENYDKIEWDRKYKTGDLIRSIKQLSSNNHYEIKFVKQE
jgi:hypothetical protein